MIDDKAVLHRLGIVVLTDDEICAALVALALNLRRKRLHVVSSLAGGARAATGNAILDHGVGHVDQHHGADLGACLLENVGLRHIAREAIEKHGDVASGLGDYILDHGGYELIWDELSGFHEVLGGLARLSAFRNGTTQKVSRRDVLEISVLGCELSRNRTLARTGRTQQNNYIHNEGVL